MKDEEQPHTFPELIEQRRKEVRQYLNNLYWQAVLRVTIHQIRKDEFRNKHTHKYFLR